MSDITSIKTDVYLGQPTTPSNQKLILAQAISSTATTLVANFEPLDEDGASITDDVYIGILRSDGFLETMLVTGISGTTFTVVRGIDPAGLQLTTGSTSFAATHQANEPILFNLPAVFVNMLYQYSQGVVAGGLKLNAAPSFSGAGIITVPIYADATARDAAITSPSNGMLCYQTDEGTLMQYISGAWASMASGTTANGSVTVAGKFEEGTVAEQGLATGTGGTGARLVPAVANLVKTSSGAGDEDKIAVLDATGAYAQGMMANAGLAGQIIAYGGSSAPTGWVLCDGTAYSRTVTYDALFAVVSTTYGVGDGSTTFNVPDLTGRVPVGKDSGTFSSLGGTGGTETHTLSEAEMPAHTHSLLAAGSGGAGGGAFNATATGNTGSTGGGNAHNNLQPYLVINYIIKI